ncbi:MBL fold metallo-hydrolase, partial [Patescibacteria group bacterium]|nr:MBL fold metallo-hydrolase [Patescibacteria group bacterium]
SKSFVGFVSPEYAVISVGADNKYGHPNQEVINILNEFGVKILKTSESGTIIFETDGELLNLFQ